MVKEMKKAKDINKIFTIASLILIFLIYITTTTVFEYYRDETKNILKEKEALEEIMELSNKYNLHNPTQQEMLAFIENNTPSNLYDLINQSKNQGIRCGYAEIILGAELYMNESIVFNISDQGIFNFESETGYYINPILNERYVDCVYESIEEKNKPYSHSYINDTIVDILIIW